MDISFDDKEGKQFSQSEINQLKRDLNAEKFQNIYNIHNNSQTFENNKINIEEEKNNENDNEIQQNYNINENDKKENNDIDNENKLTEENIIHSDHEILLKKEIDFNTLNLNSLKNENSQKKEEESKEERINPEQDIIEQRNNSNLNKKKLIELIPLWFKCLNKDHGSKYISLDKKRENLICKYCFQSGALETNLDINQEFVDSYLKELEEKNKRINTSSSKDIIKETSEENITDKDDTNNKLNKEENSSNLSNVQTQINCLTFLCENFPYYVCENCQDFICYRCIVNKMDGVGDKSRHYFHDVESVNYLANSFKDDININLETLEEIINSLDLLIKEEKNRNQEFRIKLLEENKKQMQDSCLKTFDRINAYILEKNKNLYINYCKDIYENKDNEINDLCLSNNNTKIKVKNIMDELKSIKDKINSEDISNEDKCDLHNKFIELLNKGNLFIKKGKNLISESNQILNYLNSDITKEKFNKIELIQNNLLFDKEQNLIQSLSNSFNNKGSFKLNRFVTYKHQGLQYFGFSTLEFSCNNDIVLYGIFLCGKFIFSNNIKEKEISEVSMNDRSFYEINVKIYQSNKNLLLINENKKLYEIININDPVIKISFEKGLKINKDEKYAIIVENLENKKYCDLWIGGALKQSIINNVQKIKCNNTNIEFNFYLSNNYNSDMDEFKMGIIDGILYGN